MTVRFVTGTDTDVGKTITTAALAAALVADGRSVAVYKPVQAGTGEHGDGDVDTVRRLADVTVAEGVRLPEPMAPVAAATRAGVALPPARAHLDRIAELAAHHDDVLVEGAGGVLVHLDHDATTLADLAEGAEAVVVCRSGLGTLNHTDLVLEALARRDVAVAGLVIGSWPAAPSEIDLDNRVELARRAPLLGAIPERSGALSPDRFRALAPGWADPTIRLTWRSWLPQALSDSHQ
ncbi:dethiobiotin synthase [Pseudonocardia endophytica]|uniref:ATP-dependent dethiobiotin synthetase BioD n=1 Tax=Pseudonocardia endophytica TaxID=401976 RepID=A0A4R1I039_PSEEN|nr:dethiobiotin synthase [Pseudonocardia endophytica]TCK26865.1 dethiobiotin synthetase [Pseudonocardia endophytica]